MLRTVFLNGLLQIAFDFLFDFVQIRLLCDRFRRPADCRGSEENRESGGFLEMVPVLSLVLFVLSEIFFQEFCQRNVVIGYFAVLIAEEFLRGFNSAVRRALEELCGFLEILGSSLTGVVHDTHVEFGKRGIFDFQIGRASCRERV